MRRVPRLRQPRLLLPSTPSSAAPCLRTISTSAPRCEKTSINERIRQALWKGPAPGPEDPYAQPAENKYTEEKRELEAYKAELQELMSKEYQHQTPVPTAKHRPHSRLKTKAKIGEAPLPKDATGGYTPATSAEGLEEVGTIDGWWDRPGHWGPESMYTGFWPVADKITNPAVLEVFVKQAVVEAVAIDQDKTQQHLLQKTWVADRSALDRALAAAINHDDKNNNSTLFVTLESFPKIKQPPPKDAKKTKTAKTPVAPIPLTPDEAAEILNAGDKSWKNIPLTSPAVKFAINKRIFQLTGHLIADPKLARAETASQLLNIVVRPPPAKKVYEQLVLGGELDQANVQIYQRRQTPIDKEKSVGRWKLIVKELEARGLPVTGHKDYEPHRETKWTKGGV